MRQDSEDDDVGSEIDGRLSAIMPRKLFQDDAAVKSGLLQVFVRMKPVPQPTTTCMQVDNNQLLKAVWRNKEAVYKFSKVFQQDADQATVYDDTTAPLVEDFLAFRQPSAVVMAYGVTSAGKTFTMQGSSDKPGLVPQALKNIFKSISDQRDDFKLSMSVCEIYNECIHDLLAQGTGLRPHKPAALRLQEDKAGHITVQGMSEVTVQSAKEALELLKRAAKARQSAGTAVNERSSRSHAVITVKLQSVEANRNEAMTVHVQAAPAAAALHFVDLAGCERVKRTGNSGARLRESVAINSSLMTLARCLEVLRYNQQHPADQKVIPYRESKITHIFKEVLHGQGRFVMLVNVSPAAEEFNETKRVLQYAALASKVTMTSEVEHIVAGLPWPSEDGAATAAEALAAADGAAATAAAASASASAAALAAAQAKIEELLDDKADLEYEIDVVERKVELLREELIKSEVEKDQLEANIRQEMVKEADQLILQATATYKQLAASAQEQANSLKQQVSDLEQQLHWQQELLDQRASEQQQLQASRLGQQELKASLELNKPGLVTTTELERQLQEARQLAKAQALEAEAQYIAQAAITSDKHNTQLDKLKQQLAALQQRTEASQQQAEVAAQQQARLSAEELAAAQAVAAEALQLLEQALLQEADASAAMTQLSAQALLVLQGTQQHKLRQQQSTSDTSMDDQVLAEPSAAAAAAAAAATGSTPDADQLAKSGLPLTQNEKKQLKRQSHLPQMPCSRKRRRTLAAAAASVRQPQSSLRQEAATCSNSSAHCRPSVLDGQEPLPAGDGRVASESQGIAAADDDDVFEAGKLLRQDALDEAHLPTTRCRRRASSASTVAASAGCMPVRAIPSSSKHLGLGPCMTLGSRRLAGKGGLLCSIAEFGEAAVEDQPTSAAAANAHSAAAAADVTTGLGAAAVATRGKSHRSKRRKQGETGLKPSELQSPEAGDAVKTAAAAAARSHDAPTMVQSAAVAEAAAGDDQNHSGRCEWQLQDDNRNGAKHPQQANAAAVKATGKLPGKCRIMRTQKQQQALIDNVGGAVAASEVEVEHMGPSTAVAAVDAHPTAQAACKVAGGQKQHDQPDQAAAPDCSAVMQPQQEAPPPLQQQQQELGGPMPMPPGPSQPPSQSQPVRNSKPQQSAAHRALRAADQPQQKGGDVVSCQGPASTVLEWQPAEVVLRDVTRQQLGVALGRRATIATVAGAHAARTAGPSHHVAAGKATHSKADASQLSRIAGGLTPVAFRTRHRGVRR